MGETNNFTVRHPQTAREARLSDGGRQGEGNKLSIVVEGNPCLNRQTESALTKSRWNAGP